MPRYNARELYRTGRPGVVHKLGVNFADYCALCRTLGPSR